MSIESELRHGIDTSTSWGKLEYTDWRDENLSWKQSCYIGDWSYLDELRVRGPDALRFLSAHAVNSFASYALGQAKHAIFCNQAGKVIGEGILSRWATDEFEFNARGPVVNWLEYRLRKGGYDAQASLGIREFKFQVSGPTALQVCEKVTGESLRDVGFMRFRKARVGGREVTLLRQGMAGEIGFELHGASECAEEVRTAILAAGQDLGIRQLGSRTAMVNHLEAAFPTVTHDYLPAVGDEAEREFRELHERAVPKPGSAEWFRSFARSMKVKGSYEGDRLSDWYRSPVELGWAENVSFDHQFYGREALEGEIANPKRTRVTLIWNKDDVIAAYASLFEDAAPCDYMEMPRHQWNCMYANKVMDGGKLVGVATSRGYSYYFRKMLSHCVIDIDHADFGREVTVVWGDPGTRQTPIRATVAPSPLKQDHRRADLRAIG
jgi:vanillate/3-O-methylgallate O-demethylase